jgi:CubicO group peptidase (beta-lactamase class C family)
MRALSAALATLVLTACSTAGALARSESAACSVAVAPDAALQAAINPIVDAAQAEGFAGQVALMRDGVLVYERAAGAADAAGRIPVTARTRFQTASMTKYFTAALALKAIEEGVLRLDQPIAPLFPDARLPSDITVGALLAHTSGLGTSYAAEGTDEAMAAAAAIAAAAYDPARAGAFNYSNDGYDLLGAVLERVYGARYESLVREKLLRPACLTDVAFWGEVDLTDPSVVAQPLGGFPEPLRRRNYGMLASGGLLISARDLVRWQHDLNSGRLLWPASLAQLRAPRGAMRLGQAAYGSFLIDHPRLGRVISARGAEDWGDNAYLNDYRDCGVILAVVTSRGPPENSGRPLFRDSITQAIETVLAGACAAPAQP